VLDPFAGSNTTGEICEAEGRKWIASELDKEYLETSR
jgi:DNA modification methylase